MNSSKKNSPKSTCFSSILELFTCTGNLPTHPCPLEEILEKKPNPTKNNASNIGSRAFVDRPSAQAQAQVQARVNPGIVARLMGLDSLPNHENTPLFRSRSLNSIHFLPNFDPTRATFHRRARTSFPSFHEQGHSFLGKIDENLETDGANELRQTKDTNRENALTLKENECRRNRKIDGSKKKYQQERYCKGNCSKTRNNRGKSTVIGKHVVSNENCSREKCVTTRRKVVSNEDRNIKSGSSVSSKNKVDHKQGNCVEVSSDVSLRSPISVLDHRQLEFDSPSSTEDAKPTQTTSNSNSKKISSAKINFLDGMPQLHTHSKLGKNNDDDSSNKVSSKRKLVKEEAEVTEYFANLSRQICVFAEEQLCKDSRNHIRKLRLFEAHLVEELCQDFGREMLEFLLNELTIELVEPL